MTAATLLPDDRVVARIFAVGEELVAAGDSPHDVYDDAKKIVRYLRGGGPRPALVESRSALAAALYEETDREDQHDRYFPANGESEVDVYFGRLCEAERRFARTGMPHREPTDLYYWRDEAGRLVYIGITGNLAKRQDAHGAGSTWTQFAKTCTVEKLPNRGVALVHEKYAIKREKPLFNKQHNDTPEAREALVKYLASKQRWDLLAPVISRG